jgi:hypothetical protein
VTPNSDCTAGIVRDLSSSRHAVARWGAALALAFALSMPTTTSAQDAVRIYDAVLEAGPRVECSSLHAEFHARGSQVTVFMTGDDGRMAPVGRASLDEEGRFSLGTLPSFSGQIVGDTIEGNATALSGDRQDPVPCQFTFRATLRPDSPVPATAGSVRPPSAFRSGLAETPRGEEVEPLGNPEVVTIGWRRLVAVTLRIREGTATVVRRYLGGPSPTGATVTFILEAPADQFDGHAGVLDTVPGWS